jgi:hypothetical protein
MAPVLRPYERGIVSATSMVVANALSHGPPGEPRDGSSLPLSRMLIWHAERERIDALGNEWTTRRLSGSGRCRLQFARAASAP